MKDIGIDLGTKNILIYVKNKGIVLDEPTVVAIDTETKKVLAIGTEAKDMIGRTPEKVQAISPLKEGVIADFDVTEVMLNKLIKKAIGKKLYPKPTILICCPSNITPVEKNAIKEAAERTGAKKVYLEEEAKVAAIGAGLDISRPSGNMIIDIGGGTTDIAVLSLGGIVKSSSIKIAGNTFDEDIMKYIKNKYKIIIGETTAEEIKKEIGTVNKNKKDLEKEITGKNIEDGLPVTITIKSKEIEEAIKEDIDKIKKKIKEVLEETPPELSSDIVEKGIVLTGGGSLIEGLPELLSKELKVPVFISDSPLTNVVEGTGMLLNNTYLLEN